MLCKVSECFSLQLHYQIKLSCTRGHRRLEPIPAVTGWMQETPCTGLMLITGLTYREKNKHTHMDNSEMPVNVICQEGTHAGRTVQTLHSEELRGEDANYCILLSPLIHLNIFKQLRLRPCVRNDTFQKTYKYIPVSSSKEKFWLVWEPGQEGSAASHYCFRNITYWLKETSEQSPWNIKNTTLWHSGKRYSSKHFITTKLQASFHPNPFRVVVAADQESLRITFQPQLKENMSGDLTHKLLSSVKINK